VKTLLDIAPADAEGRHRGSEKFCRYEFDSGTGSVWIHQTAI